MRGGDDDTVPVDLIEVDSPDALLPSPGDVEEPPDGVPGSAPPARRRRRRSVLVALSAAVVLGLAGTGLALSVLDERRADARWDALAARGLPLVRLGDPLEEAWRVDFGGYPMTAAADVLVLQAFDPTAPTSPWRAIDLATGEVVWERTDLGLGWCTQWNPTWTDEMMGIGALLVRTGGAGTTPAPPTLLICADAGFGGQVPALGATATIHVVEIATGHEIGSVVVDGDVVSFDPVGDDVVVASVVPDGTIELARMALVGGAVRWVADTDLHLVDQEGMLMAPWAQIVDGVLYLVAPDGALVGVRSVDTGEPLTGVPDPPETSVARQVLPDGSTVEGFYPGMLWVGDSEAVDVPTVTVTGPDGAERFSIEGELWAPFVTDGSMGDRVVVVRWGQGASSLAALDVQTGEELWTSRAPWSSPVLQVDGVVVAGSGYVTGLDLRTGTKLWERQAVGDFGLAPITDGSRILVPVSEDGATSLTALDVRTGAEVWRTPTVSGIQLALPVDGGVLVGTDSTLVMYR